MFLNGIDDVVDLESSGEYWPFRDGKAAMSITIIDSNKNRVVYKSSRIFIIGNWEIIGRVIITESS